MARQGRTIREPGAVIAATQERELVEKDLAATLTAAPRTRAVTYIETQGGNIIWQV